MKKDITKDRRPFKIVKGEGKCEGLYFLNDDKDYRNCLGCYFEVLGLCTIPAEMEPHAIDGIVKTRGHYKQISKEVYEELDGKNKTFLAEEEAKEWERSIKREFRKNAIKNLDELTLASAAVMRDLLVWARGQNDGGFPWPKAFDEDIKLLYEVLKKQGAKIHQ